MCKPNSDKETAANKTSGSLISDGGTKYFPSTDKTSSSTTSTTSEHDKATTDLKLGTLYGSLSLALLISGFSLIMPHMQSRRDTLQCDSLCLGSMTSARSALTLIGGFVVSRLSDSDTNIIAKLIGQGNGRKGCLYIGTLASVAGLIIGIMTFSVRGMWLAMIPGALLQQNFNVLKALMADYHEAVAVSAKGIDTAAEEGDDTDQKKKDKSAEPTRAGSVGKLGMSVGLAFMVGPLLGATLVKTYEGATMTAILLTLLSMVTIAKLPKVHTTPTKQSKDDTKESEEEKEEEKKKNGLLSFFDVKAARSPSVLFLMSIRVCMTLAFHIFQTIWTVSLKTRFDFGPSDHGKFMSFIGLTYAISQGFVAKHVVKPLGPKGRIYIIQASCIALGIGRYVAFQTSNLVAVYGMFAFIVTALGVMNTILTSDASTLAPPEEIGGLYGVLEAVQSIAGMVGPMVGGMLSLVDPMAPLLSVVALYGVIFLLVTFGYERFIIRKGPKESQKML